VDILEVRASQFRAQGFGIGHEQPLRRMTQSRASLTVGDIAGGLVISMIWFINSC